MMEETTDMEWLLLFPNINVKHKYANLQAFFAILTTTTTAHFYRV